MLQNVAEAEESNTEIQREKVAAEEDQQAQQNASLPTAQRSTMETELKKALERAQLAEKNADLTDPNQGMEYPWFHNRIGKICALAATLALPALINVRRLVNMCAGIT